MITIQKTNELLTLAAFYNVDYKEFRDRIIKRCIDRCILFADDYGVNLVQALNNYDTDAVSIAIAEFGHNYPKSAKYWLKLTIISDYEDCPACGYKMIEVGPAEPFLESDTKECEYCECIINLKG